MAPKISATATALCLGALVLTGCISDVTGERYDEVRQCWGGQKEFAYSGPSGCDESMTFAADKNGGIWRFRNSCIGDGLTPVPFNGFNDDCPPFGTELVDVMARQVSDDNTCLEAPYVIERVPSDHECLGEEPGVFASTNDTYIENGCNLSYTWEPVSEARRLEVLALPDCE